MKNKLQFIPVCVAALALCAPALVTAAPKASPTPSTATSPAAATKGSPPATKTTTARAIPFKGVIASVDQTAKTFTIAGKEKSRVFTVTDKSVITKAGAAATMKDLMANEEIRGSYWKGADGTLEVKTAKIGAMTDAEKAAGSKGSKKKAKEEASSGTSPAVSPAASPSVSPKP